MNMQKDSSLVKLYIDIAKEYNMALKLDSAIFYCQKSLDLAKKVKFQNGEAQALSYLGEYHEGKGARQEAIKYYNEAYTLYNLLKNRSRAATMLNYIGVTYDYLGEFDKALKYLFQSAQIKEEVNNFSGLSDVYNDIGIVYEQMNEPNKALDYYQKSLKILLDNQLSQRKISNIYNNIGVIYYDKMDYDKALENFNKSFEIRKSIKSPKLESNYYNIANIYFQKKEYIKALDLYYNALALASEQKLLEKISNYHVVIGQTHLYLKKYDSAAKYIQNGYDIAKKYNFKYTELYSYFIQGRLDSAQNNYQKAFETQKKYITLKDSLLNSEKISKIAKYQTAYETGRKIAENEILKKDKEKQYAENKLLIEMQRAKIAENEILRKEREKEDIKAQFQEKENLFLRQSQKLTDLENLNLKREKEELESKKVISDSEKDEKDKQIQIQFWAIFFSSIVITLILALLLALYHSNIKKTVAYKLLSDSTNEVQHKNEEISSQAEILKLYNEQIKQQNKELVNAYSKMTDSIMYAERLQYAVVGNEQDLKILYPKSFVLYMPKDIVSGDFLWTAQVEQFKIIVVADCTGHGVPGSLMTFLGVSALNEIIHTKHITSPKEILEELDKRIIEFLSKHSEKLQKSDGMDAVVICIDEKDKLLSYAGAKNPLYRIRKGELEIFTASIFSLGFNIFGEEKVYKNQVIPLEEDDIFYAFSDGYQDQFGGDGETPKKYLNKRFKESLIEITNLPPQEQKNILIQKLKKWKGLSPQTDDIIIVGFQV
ncbi:MAG: tetratricopeptide repeat protein [Raineya sp.]|jgi:tetratricopeptide (TPR) repeat protein|nr:tetratricopeptide repeat protein [Raineya sp.]